MQFICRESATFEIWQQITCVKGSEIQVPFTSVTISEGECCAKTFSPVPNCATLAMKVIRFRQHFNLSLYF